MKTLLVEDNPADARLIREMLKESPVETFQFQQVARLDSALERLRQESFDVVLLDLGLPDSQGMETLTLTRKASGGLPIVVLTGLHDERFALEAVRAGAQDYLVKGRFDSELLVRVIRYAIQRKWAEEEVRRMNAELELRVAERTAQLQTANDELLKEIAERKRMEGALRESESLYRELFEHMAEGLAYCKMIFENGEGRDFVYLAVNPAFETLTGLKEVIGKRATEVIPDIRETDPELFEIYGRVALTRVPEKFEMFVEALGMWFSISAYSPEKGFFVAIFDVISERKRAEDALRQSEERWAITLQSIGDAVISTCAEGKVVFMNDVAQKLTGWPLSEAQGKDLNEVFNIVNEVTRIKPESPVHKVIRLGQIVGLANHTALIRRDGTEIPIEDSGAPIRDNQGHVTGVVLVFHDISDKRRAEKAVRDSERLATTGRLASTLAHEIHNPLDSVGNLLFLIDRDPDVPETARQYVAMAIEELTRITQMTQHMLSFQREAKQPVPVKIGEILDNVIALHERKIQSAGIQLEKQVEFEGEFLGLPGEMRQVFANLVGNAIEAIGQNGKIRLRAYAGRDWRLGRRGLRVTVADNGPGIPAAIRDKIFDPFFTTKGESGTGLGLWITSGVVEKNDGMLRLRTVTRDGRSGTCFSVFFPFPA